MLCLAKLGVPTLPFALALSAAAVLTAHCPAARADDGETVLHNFEGGSDGNLVYSPLTEASDGTFYGTTSNGGISGTVFKIDPSGNYSVLHNFADGSVPSDGEGPIAGLTVGSDGSLYGTTEFGGSGNDGTVYKITPAGKVTILHPFTGGSDGAYPFAGIAIGKDGKLYGATPGDGGSSAAGEGTLFSMNTDGSGYVVQYRFGSANEGTAGEQPQYTLAAAPGSANLFYGATEYGGSAGYGTLFKFMPGMTDGSGQLQALHAFGDGTVANDGENPGTGCLQIDDGGNLYGTTIDGGVYGDGTVFQLMLGSANTETVLHSFNPANDGEGSDPASGVLLASDGNLYGATLEGGNFGASTGDGTLFSIGTDGSNFGTVYQFEGSDDENSNHIGDGEFPYASPIEDSNGNLFGTTEDGGDFTNSNTGYGTVYEYAAGLPDPVKLASISITPNPVSCGAAATFATINFNRPVPSGGADVDFTSSDTTVATVASNANFRGNASGGFVLDTYNLSQNSDVLQSRP